MPTLCLRVLAWIGLALGAIAPPGAHAAEDTAGIELSTATSTPVERAWRAPASGLPERVERTRAASLALGVRSVDTAAHALLASVPEPGLAEARAAVRLAPDLPVAHWALARASFHDASPLAATRAAVASLRAIEHHLEASIWLRGALLGLAAAALAAGGLLFVALAAAGSARHAAHDLGDLISRELPPFARAALLGLLLLTPAFLGEGLCGVAVAVFAMALVFADSRRRLALVAAAAAFWLGAFPLSRMAGDRLAALSDDPVARAVAAVERGSSSPLHLTRLERAADSDLLAASALALRARRTGDAAAADARYTVLLESRPTDPVLANNAANVRMALGDTEGAIELYQSASRRLQSAVIQYNLSQAYGQAILPLEQDRALARAQALDFETVDELTELNAPIGAPFLADLPTPMAELRSRLLEGASWGRLGGAGGFAGVAAGLSPSGLLDDGRLCGLVLAALALLCPALATRFRASRACDRCGGRVCPRCHGQAQSFSLCTACARLFKRPEGTDPALRTARLLQLRRRQLHRDRVELVAALLVPGAAGLLTERPFLAVLAAIPFAGAAASALLAAGGLPEPAAAGGAAALAIALFGALSGLLYAVLTALGVMLRSDA